MTRCEKISPPARNSSTARAAPSPGSSGNSADRSSLGLQGLAAQATLLVTTNYVLVETMAVAQRRLGLEALRALVGEVIPVLDVVFVDETIHAAAIGALLAAGRRQLSLVDCASFEVMRRRRVASAFAYDRHFTDQGFDAV